MLTRKRPSTLAAMLEKAEARRDAALGHILDAALHGQERIADIRARLGPADPRNVALDRANAAVEKIRAECRRRYGPDAVTFESMWLTFLQVRAPR